MPGTYGAREVSMMTTGSDDTSLDVPTLTRLARAFSVVAVVGLCLGVLVASLSMWEKLPGFVASNQLPMRDRKGLLAWVLVTAVAYGVLSVVMALRAASLRDFAVRLGRTAARFGWLGPVALLPLLFYSALWEGRLLSFLLACALVSVSTVAAVVACPIEWRGGGLELVLRAMAPRPRTVRIGLGSASLLVVAFCAWRYFGPDPLIDALFLRERELLIRLGKTEGSFFSVVLESVRALGHLSLPVPLLASLGDFIPSPRLLRVLHLGAVILAVVPLLRLGRRRLGSGLGALLALGYVVLPLVHTSAVAEPFPLALALPFFFSAAHAVETRRTWSTLLFGALTCLVHEQACFWFVPLAVVLGQRPGELRRAIGLFLVPLAYFILVEGWLLPFGGVTRYTTGFSGAWARPEPGLWPTFWVPLENPGFAALRWFETQRLGFWLAIIVPFGTLFLSARFRLLYLVPPALFAILATTRNQEISPSGQYLAHFVAMGFLMMLALLAESRQRDALEGTHQRWALALGWLAALAPVAFRFGGLLLP